MLLLGAIVCVLAVYRVAAIAVIPADLSDSPPVQYTNSWAVEVSGGEEKANALAAKHGFVNTGKVRRAKYMWQYSSRVIVVCVWNSARLYRKGHAHVFVCLSAILQKMLLHV